jgi:catechol 2,3-dioxygenase-like lactoylglutathione lyase family enzyme
MITAAIPKLPFIDKSKTAAFYTKFGFVLTADYGDYFLMNAHGVELHFFSYPTLQPNKSDFMIYLRVATDIATYLEKTDNSMLPAANFGVLETKPWGQQEFAIVDPNGTLLTFGQAV